MVKVAFQSGRGDYDPYGSPPKGTYKLAFKLEMSSFVPWSFRGSLARDKFEGVGATWESALRTNTMS